MTINSPPIILIILYFLWLIETHFLLLTEKINTSGKKRLLTTMHRKVKRVNLLIHLDNPIKQLLYTQLTQNQCKFIQICHMIQTLIFSFTEKKINLNIQVLIFHLTNFFTNWKLFFPLHIYEYSLIRFWFSKHKLCFFKKKIILIVACIFYNTKQNLS